MEHGWKKVSMLEFVMEFIEYRGRLTFVEALADWAMTGGVCG